MMLGINQPRLTDMDCAGLGGQEKNLKASLNWQNASKKEEDDVLERMPKAKAGLHLYISPEHAVSGAAVCSSDAGIITTQSLAS
jgi:hypothetical protein